MKNESILIREANFSEFKHIGKLLVDIYSKLDGFPSKEDQPTYYQLLENIGQITQKTSVKLFVAVINESIAGAVVYFGDMSDYGSGGIATSEKNAAGFRLLAVDHLHRGKGLGRKLTQHCIDQAKYDNLNQVIIHSTKAMSIAWKMYESMGFKRSPDLDFEQENLSVFGFRLPLRM